MIVGISGKSGSGKDTVFSMMKEIERIGEFKNLKFSSALKEISAGLLGVKEEDFESQEFKASVIPTSTEGMTYRDFLLEMGTGIMRKADPNYWVKLAMEEAKTQQAMGWEIVFTDMRFPNEMQAVKDAGGITLRVDMAGNIGVDHISDKSLDDAIFDYRITAMKSDLDGLRLSVKEFMRKNNLI